MKKVISMLMVLTLMLSLVGGIGVSAFASEEPETGDEALVPVLTEEVGETEEAEEPAEEPAEDATAEPAEEEATGEPAEEEATGEPAEEPEEVSEDGESVDSNSLEADKTYVIGVSAGSKLNVLQDDGGTLKVAEINTAADADDTMKWVAAAGSTKGGVTFVSLKNKSTGKYLYYKDGYLNSSEKKNWALDNGVMSYDASGTLNYLYINGTTVSAATSGGTYSSDITATEATAPAVKKYAVTLSGSAVVATQVAGTSDFTAAMEWTAADSTSGTSGTMLKQGSYNLYYDGSVLASAANGKGRWSFDGGDMYYTGSGKKYIAGVDGTSVGYSSDKKSTVTLYSVSGGSYAEATALTVGTTYVIVFTETTTAVSSSSDSSSSESSSSDSTTYTEVTGLTTSYIAAVNTATNIMLGLDQGSWEGKTVTIGGTAPARTVSPSKSTSIQVTQVGSDYTLKMQDPPDTWNFIYVDETGALKADDKDNPGQATDFNHWNMDANGLYYMQGSTKYYLVDVSASPVVSTTPGTNIVFFGGSSAASGGSDKGGDTDSSITTDATAPQITAEPEAVQYVLVNTQNAAPKYSITVTVPEATLTTGVDGGKIYFQWYVDGEKAGDPVAKNIAGATATTEFTDTLTVKALANQTVTGVHKIYCQVYCDITAAGAETATTYTNTSVEVSFIVCKGVDENSFITFSDVHGNFSDIGVAISETMTAHGGLVPALVLCTGDWVNKAQYNSAERGSENYQKTLDTYITRLAAQVGGIDIVYVAGNHDSGLAAADASIESNLGAAEDFSAEGVVYSSHADTEDVGSSAANEGLQVYSLAYEITKNGYTQSVRDNLEAFLLDVVANHPSDLVVISSHTGLHVLGTSGSTASEWGGGSSYNQNDADKMVDLLNEYADLGLDIMFFFGHDHSKSEKDFILVPGDQITSIVKYSSTESERESAVKTLKFTYATAGFLISGNEDFSYVTWDDNEIVREMYNVGDNETKEVAEPSSTLTKTITRVADVIRKTVKFDTGDTATTATDNFILGEIVEKPADPIRKGYTFGGWYKDAACTLAWNFATDVVTADTTLYAKWTADPVSDKDTSATKAPKTGDDNNILLWTVVLAACTVAVVVLPRKKVQ